MKFGLPSSINSPLPSSLKSECKKATKILNSFINTGEGIDSIIPSNILEKAQGLAIFTVLKAGFLFSGRAGSGLVVARLPNGSWSAPSAIVIGGIGAGGQIGAELTDFVLVLNTKEAVKTFSHSGNITLGGNISIAAGPVGRNAEASGSATFKHISAIYSYNRTRGLFAGVSLEGSVIITRNDANEKMYEERYTAKELLNGTVAPPHEADSLYRALNAKFKNLGNMGLIYQRRIEQEESKGNNHKTTNISAPGTLPIPEIQQRNGNGLPNIQSPSIRSLIHHSITALNPMDPYSPLKKHINNAPPVPVHATVISPQLSNQNLPNVLPVPPKHVMSMTLIPIHETQSPPPLPQRRVQNVPHSYDENQRLQLSNILQNNDDHQLPPLPSRKVISSNNELTSSSKTLEELLVADKKVTPITYSKPNSPLTQRRPLPPLFDGQKLDFIREIKSSTPTSPGPLPPLFDGQKIDFAREIKSSTPASRVPSLNKTKAKALKTFVGEEDGSLSFSEGEIITIIKNSDSDLWTGNLNGCTGTFPANHVELL